MGIHMRLLSIMFATLLSMPAVALADDNILSTAASNGSFKTLVNLVVAADLDEALQGDGEFTVFAPTDEAFAKLPAETLESLTQPENREQLASILKYHVIPREISVPKRPPSHPLKSAKTLMGKRIRFERNGSDVKVNNANVIIRNIKCSNGLIQVIDAVLIPPADDDNSIVGVAKQAGNFTTLLATTEAAGLVDALNGDGPLTVFAPTDEAFKALPEGTVKNLLKPENKEQLATILKYHVVPGNLSARDAVKSGRTETLAGQDIEFSIREGRISVNDSTVIRNDIQTNNGIIHVIDRVLLPGPSTSDSSSRSKGPSEVTITAGWDKSVDRDGITADRITIRCLASGSVRLTNVSAREIVTQVSGGGSVTIDGSAERHEVTVYGGATLRARNLSTLQTKIQVYGGGVAVVNATDQLTASAASGASIRYVDTGAEIDKQINKYAEFIAVSADDAETSSR